MASQAPLTLTNLDNADESVKRAVIVLIRAAEVAQQKGAFTLDDAALVHDAKKLFVGSSATPKEGQEGEGK